MTTYDAFISHSSGNTALAERIQRALETDYDVWLDQSDIRIGVLLRNELQQNIANSRSVVLLWSEPAAASRWVAAEVLTAFHLDRFIVPCVVDDAPLPPFLDRTVYLDLRRDEAGGIERLRRALRATPDAANEVPPRMVSRSADLGNAIQVLVQGQQEVTRRLTHSLRDLDEARQLQQVLDDVMHQTEQLWPLDAMVLNLAGYHHKNGYLLNHWDAIQAGRPPKDPLLERAERLFFDSLFVDPLDYSALNGLGSILILEHELDAAEFFVRRALALADADGVDYTAARYDLATIQRFKAA